MNGARDSAAREPWGRLPAWLRPRESEVRGTGRLRLVESTLLVLAAVLLATATLNDVSRQAHTNQRLIADLRTWRSYTGHEYRNLSIEQEVFGLSSHREVVCGNTSPGGPKARVQICLVIAGPTHAGRREVQGGWSLPPLVEDERADRYGCFGALAEGMCPR